MNKFFNDPRNLTMLMDYYQLTMSNGYLSHGFKDTTVYFDMFFRKVPDKGGFAIACGLEAVVDYIKSLKFEESDIEFLKAKGIFSKDFLDYLRNFKFTCDIWAVPEGTVVFPNEPILTVCGPILEAQLIETMILLTINHQSLIATKTSRIVRAAQGRNVMEFGSRRAQGYDGAIYGARAAYIAGAIGSSNVYTDMEMGIPAIGTMAHSWVQLFGDEYEAFKAYAKIYPDNCTLLVDTYNVLKSGIPNAIRVAKEVLEPLGKRLKGIRLDSGDMAYLSKECRRVLDKEGLWDCKIVASNSLDEFIIKDLISQGAYIDTFGVGERLITSKSEPVFGGVYKLVAVKEGEEIVPRIKLSENVEKVTNPHYKGLWRLYEKESGKAIADILTIHHEVIDETKPYVLFDPVFTWKKKIVENFKARRLQVKIFEKGELVYNLPKIEEIKNYCREEVNSLWDELKRFEYPHKYYVDLSEELWNIKNSLIEEYKDRI
ncbi:nicotinate phosphoribosyltransferase [Clostridium sp. UBA4548]|uniref:nicotinate phosphoribosyltransferase n=1 Tax=Clostridium sp. UBA4548 TaxID=1946361 RepID=UPI0025C68B93|nr:nicotinate phosphoribosyltransferase [Clostridium sp. UBA4548]